MEIKKFLDKNPSFQIIQSASQIHVLLSKILKKEEVNFLQALILISIFFEKTKGVRPGSMVDAFNTSKGNISHSLSRLEELKLIQRFSSPNDHRSFTIKLTAAGKKKSVRLIEYFSSLQENFENNIGEDQIDIFHQTINKIKNLHKHIYTQTE